MKQKIRSNLYLEVTLPWEMDYRSLTGLKKKNEELYIKKMNMVKERNINPKTILPQSVSTSYCAKKKGK